MEENQFDTIYHEHFSYFSLLTAEKIFAAYGLVLFDVEELPTHGGSLRIFGRHAEDASKPVSPRVLELRAREEAAGTGTHRELPLLRRESEEHQAPTSGVPDPGQAGGQVDRRIWSPGKGQYAVELLRGGNRFPRLHGGSQSLQARAIHAWDAYSHLSAPNAFLKPGRTTC